MARYKKVIKGLNGDVQVRLFKADRTIVFVGVSCVNYSPKCDLAKFGNGSPSMIFFDDTQAGSSECYMYSLNREQCSNQRLYQLACNNCAKCVARQKAKQK